ncbi:MAG: hypothetical protein JW969_18350 [Spirochaetales bacterium]|nr:hypothetical protein [Spirochaetales bacterium]
MQQGNILSTDVLQAMDHRYDVFNGSKKADPDLVKQGLYTPLCVTGKKVVWGYPILETAPGLGVAELQCVAIPDSTAEDELKWALKLENRTGKYSFKEKEKIVSLLSPGIDSSYHGLVRMIEGRDDPGFFDRINRYSHFSMTLKKAVNQGIVDYKTASETSDLPEACINRLFTPGCLESFSFSNRRIFLVQYYEVVRRDKLDCEKALDVLEDILKSESPLENLSGMRFPLLTASRRQFDTFKEKYLPSAGIRLTPPDYFEGDHFSVSFSFYSKKSLARKISKLKNIEEHSDELFDIL